MEFTLMNLATLQRKQFTHDINYHQDIVALSTQDRAKHLVLHLTKYMGKILLNKENVETTIFADIIICCLSLANILKFKIQSQSEENTNTIDDFLILFSLSISKMAKACEALDHMENFPSHDVLEEETNRIFSLLLQYLSKNQIGVAKIVKRRWRAIEQKDITT